MGPPRIENRVDFRSKIRTSVRTDGARPSVRAMVGGTGIEPVAPAV